MHLSAMVPATILDTAHANAHWKNLCIEVANKKYLINVKPNRNKDDYSLIDHHITHYVPKL